MATCALFGESVLSVVRFDNGKEITVKPFEILFMDTPSRSNLEELVLMADDKTYWKTLEQLVPSHIRELEDSIYVYL